jgi:predicted MFS family arabinose efflux permease
MLMKGLRNRVVVAFLVFNLLAGTLFVGGALLVSFMRSFGTTPAQLGLILSAGWAAGVLGALVGGSLTDRVGPRRSLLLVVAVVGVSLLGKGVSRTWLQAGAWYLVSMGAQAAFSPAGMALLRASVGEGVGGSLGFVSTALSLAAIPGAALTGWVVDRAGWSTLYVLKFFTYIVAWAALALLIPVAEGGRPEQAETGGWRAALHNPALVWICASVFVLTAGGYAGSFCPYFVQARFAVGVRELAWFDSIYNAVWVLSNWPAGLLADRVGSGRVAMVGYGLMGLGWLLFPLGPSLLALYGLYAVYCLGNSVGLYASVFAQDLAPEQLRGRAVGLFNTAMYLGSAFGDGAGGLLWQRLGAYFSFALAAGSSFVASLLLLLGRKREQATRA